MKTTAEKLAQCFAGIVQQWATPEELEEIKRRNATPEYDAGICATHDFMDANMAMWEAFKLTLGREPETSNPANYDLQEEDFRLWGEAWGIAKAKYLSD